MVGALLHLAEHRQAVALLAGRVEIDEVVEPGAVDRKTEVRPAHAPARVGLEPPCGLRRQVGVADLELLGGDMRPVGEQFLGRRCARRTRAVEAETEARHRAPGEAQGCREGIERPPRVGRFGRDLGPLVARPALDLERVELEFLQREQSEALGRVGGDEGFRAGRGEVAVQVLSADRPAPPAATVLYQLDPALDALDREPSADLVSFQLEVSVVGVGPACRQLVEQPVAEFDRTAQVGPPLLERDRDRFGAVPVALLLVFLAFLVRVMRAGPRWHAVAAVVVADRDPETGAAAEPGEAAAERDRLGRARGQHAAPARRLGQLCCFLGMAFFEFLRRVREQLLPQRFGQHEAGDFDVVGAPPRPVDVECQ